MAYIVNLTARAQNDLAYLYAQIDADVRTRRLYEGLAGEYAHQVIDHAVKYVDWQVHTNGLENFWSLLKRGINGTYVSVEPFHLFRYLDERAFRYKNRRDMNDADRCSLAVSQIVGKRLMFNHFTGKTEPQA